MALVALVLEESIGTNTFWWWKQELPLEQAEHILPDKLWTTCSCVQFKTIDMDINDPCVDRGNGRGRLVNDAQWVSKTTAMN